MNDKEAKSVIESLLFISGDPVTYDTLKKLTEINRKDIENHIKELITEYSTRNSGLLIIEVAGGVQMVTNPACAPWIRKLLSASVPKRLSQSSLETLAIVAYKQPIIKAEIEAIRGVNSDGVIKTLLERRLIKILGRKEAPGRPLMYGTTQEFLQYFGLKDLTELPTLKEFEEVDIPEPPEKPPEDIEVKEEVQHTEDEEVKRGDQVEGTNPSQDEQKDYPAEEPEDKTQ